MPSQQGFGTDLSASDTIIPIIDLTEAAEGSDVPQILQTALAFGSQTFFSISNSTNTLINTTGFYRVVGVTTIESTSSALNIDLRMNDGATEKTVWQHLVPASGSADSFMSIQFDLVFFLPAGMSLIGTSNNTSAVCAGSTRQIADINGTLVQPVGFTPS